MRDLTHIELRLHQELNTTRKNTPPTTPHTIQLEELCKGTHLQVHVVFHVHIYHPMLILNSRYVPMLAPKMVSAWQWKTELMYSSSLDAHGLCITKLDLCTVQSKYLSLQSQSLGVLFSFFAVQWQLQIVVQKMKCYGCGNLNIP